MDELDEILNITQRRKRGMAARKNRAKLKRSRDIAKRRMAKEENIKKRAYRQARRIVRKKFASKKGENYANLTPSEKITVDNLISKKTKLIQRLAKRLIPVMRKQEAQRLRSFMQGAAMKNINEDFNNKIGSFVEKCDDDKKAKKKSKNEIIQYDRFTDEKEAKSKTYESLARKAEAAGLDVEILGEVYNRGYAAWKPGKVSQEQYAFARVNSYINQGKTYFNEDSDLHVLSELSRDKILDYANKAGEYGEKHKPNRVKGFNTALVKLGAGKAKVYADGVKEDLDEEKEIDWDAWGKRYDEVMNKYGGKYLTAKKDGKDIGGYVTGHNHNRAGHVILRVTQTTGSRHTKNDEYKDYSVHEKHLREGGKKISESLEEGKIKDIDLALKHDSDRVFRNRFGKTKAEQIAALGAGVKPHYADPKEPNRQTGWIAKNNLGQERTFGMTMKAFAMKHVGIKTEEVSEAYFPANDIGVRVAVDRQRKQKSKDANHSLDHHINNAISRHFEDSKGKSVKGALLGDIHDHVKEWSNHKISKRDLEDHLDRHYKLEHGHSRAGWSRGGQNKRSKARFYTKHEPYIKEETLDEISSQTLSSYKSKASAQLAGNKAIYDPAHHDKMKKTMGSDDPVVKHMDKQKEIIRKRESGLKRFSEFREENLNEISKKTLKSYLAKTEGPKDYDTSREFRNRMVGQSLAKGKLSRGNKKGYNKNIKVRATNEETLNESTNHKNFIKHLQSRYELKDPDSHHTEKYKGITVHNSKFKRAKDEDDYHLATSTINHNTKEVLHRFFKAGKHDLPASVSYREKLDEEALDEISKKTVDSYLDKTAKIEQDKYFNGPKKTPHDIISDKEFAKAKARAKSINLAVSKLTGKASSGSYRKIPAKVMATEEGNVQVDSSKRLVGTDELVRAYKKDTPGQGEIKEAVWKRPSTIGRSPEEHDEVGYQKSAMDSGHMPSAPGIHRTLNKLSDKNSFRKAIQRGRTETIPAHKWNKMNVQNTDAGSGRKGFETLHPEKRRRVDKQINKGNKMTTPVMVQSKEGSKHLLGGNTRATRLSMLNKPVKVLKIREEQDSEILKNKLSETSYTSDKQPVIVPAHKDEWGNTIPAKTHMRRTRRAIVNKNDNSSDSK